MAGQRIDAREQNTTARVPLGAPRLRSCVDCSFCKVKRGVLAYCSKGFWTKLDGSPKYISSRYLSKSKLAQTAVYCESYDGEE